VRSVDITDKEMMSVLNRDKVLQPSECFRGLAYSDLCCIYYNAKISRMPYDECDKVVFLHGSYPLPSLRANLEIKKGTGVFLCVNSSELNLGEEFDGKVLATEQDLRRAVCLDLKGCTSKYATIRNHTTGETQNIVENLDEFEIESRLFMLVVPKGCPSNLKIDQFDDSDYGMKPLEEGIYHGVVDGYFVLLKNLEPGEYTIKFGTTGPKNFSSEAEYHIKIVP
jgi:hypothetical protein